MTQLNQIYKCNVCGNIVAVVHAGAGELVCCGQPMQLQPEKTADEGREKHIPVIEKTESGLKIKVGSIPHPMEEAHFIEWVEIIADGKTYRQFLKPGQESEAGFTLQAADIIARKYCNLHSLWRTSDYDIS